MSPPRKAQYLGSEKKKKWPVSKFLYTSTRKGVDYEYNIYFHGFFDKKIRHTFLGQKLSKIVIFEPLKSDSELYRYKNI